MAVNSILFYSSCALCASGALVHARVVAAHRDNDKVLAEQLHRLQMRVGGHARGDEVPSKKVPAKHKVLRRAPIGALHYDKILPAQQRVENPQCDGEARGEPITRRHEKRGQLERVDGPCREVWDQGWSCGGK